MHDIKISVHCKMHICDSKLIAVSDLETHKEMYAAVFLFSVLFLTVLRERK